MAEVFNHMAGSRLQLCAYFSDLLAFFKLAYQEGLAVAISRSRASFTEKGPSLEVNTKADGSGSMSSFESASAATDSGAA